MLNINTKINTKKITLFLLLSSFLTVQNSAVEAGKRKVKGDWEYAQDQRRTTGRYQEHQDRNPHKSRAYYQPGLRLDKLDTTAYVLTALLLTASFLPEVVAPGTGHTKGPQGLQDPISTPSTPQEPADPPK